MDTVETIHVLAVDDDPEYIEVIRHYLRPFQGKNFTVTWANSGETALQTLKSTQDVDLVLMDYFLPNTNGVEVTRQITAGGIDTPIVLLSSNKDFRIAVEAMKYGVEDYLIKEETVDTMLPRTILAVLERTKLRRRVKSAENEKRMAQEKVKAVQELVVTMCHEFNNPLAAIKISADILIRQNLPDEDKQLLNQLNNYIGLLEKQIVKLRDLNSEQAL